MDYEIEKDWITEAGLRAIVIIGPYRCGYVGVPPDSKLYGKGYDERLDFINQNTADSQTIGKKSPMLYITATCGSDADDKIRRSLDIVIDVHGGITYSDGDGIYPVPSDLWWFGFDCGHYNDDEDGGRSLEYCMRECESMAQQLFDLQAKNDINIQQNW